mgnify:CR=1 FL=1
MRSIMRVRDLLSMTTGHIADTTASLQASEDGNWKRAFFEQPPAGFCDGPILTPRGAASAAAQAAPAAPAQLRQSTTIGGERK